MPDLGRKRIEHGYPGALGLEQQVEHPLQAGVHAETLV
jgi:hypothetical protein